MPTPLAKPCPKRAGGGFHAGGQAEFRVAGGQAAPLAEALQLIQRQIITGQVQQAVEQHRAMPARKDEAVAVRPARVGRVVAQMARPDGIGHRGGAHRQAGVAGVGLLHAIGGEKPDGVDGQILKLLLSLSWFVPHLHLGCSKLFYPAYRR